MKITIRALFYLFGAMLLVSGLGQRCLAKERDMDSSPEELKNTSSVTDPGEEARQIRRLVKLALSSTATDAVKKTLADEIAHVEKNRKLKEEVVKHLLQDDDVDRDPTLPKVVQVNYKDGTLRGLLFIQADAPPSEKPAKIAWPLDAKREKKEMGQH